MLEQGGGRLHHGRRGGSQFARVCSCDNYAEASPRAIEKTIEGVPVRVISREDLIANKRASGRTKDLADAEILEGLGK